MLAKLWGTLQAKRPAGKKAACLVVLVLGFVCLSVLQVSQARDYTQKPLMSAADRTVTHQALLAVKKKQWQKAEELIAQTRNPLAAKLYYWLYYTNKRDDIQFDRITSFIRQNPNWPLQGTLQLRAEKVMPQGLSDAEIIRWFDDYSPRTSDGMERYLKALIRNKKIKTARNVLQGWWKNTSLTAPQQKHFIKSYGKLIDKKAHLARLDTSLHNRNYTNARTLARLLGQGYPELVEARIALAQKTSGVDAAIARVPAHLQKDPGLLLERVRWRRQHNNNFGAMELLHNMPPIEAVPNPQYWWKERHIIARRLIETKQYESAYLLIEKHKQEVGVPFAEAEFLAGWLALRFVKKPWKAFEHFEALYHRTSTPISRSRGAYWAARASEALGHPEIARKWYRTAARHQITFYGQLAIAELSDEYKPPQQLPPEKTVKGQELFEKKNMVQAARLLNSAGLREETTDFLNALARHVETPEEYRLVADLATELGHHHNAIRIAKKGIGKSIFLMDQAYPTMMSRMKNIEQEWALLHALMRQESAFDEKAKSPAGARGLMQLMPATAKEVAQKNKLSHKTSWLTSRPDHNIRLGSLYIQQMLDRYDGSYALALAAYNGGPGRVSRWLKEFGDPRTGAIDMIDWIELIPISETRNYVQRVMEGIYVYRLKLMNVQKSANSPIHVALNPTN